MYSIHLPNTSFAEFMNEINTVSQLNKMLALLSEDSEVGEIRLTGRKLSKEKRRVVGTGEYDLMENWQLNEEEELEFFNKLLSYMKKVHNVELNSGKLMTIQFKKSRTLITYNEEENAYSLLFRKPLDPSFNIASRSDEAQNI